MICTASNSVGKEWERQQGNSVWSKLIANSLGMQNESVNDFIDWLKLKPVSLSNQG